MPRQARDVTGADGKINASYAHVEEVISKFGLNSNARMRARKPRQLRHKAYPAKRHRDADPHAAGSTLMANFSKFAFSLLELIHELAPDGEQPVAFLCEQLQQGRWQRRY